MELNEKLIAPCGLYCGWCPYYIVGTENFKCEGCFTRDKCTIRDCAEEKGLRLCTYCHEFPCKKLYEMYGRMSEFFNQIRRDFPEGIGNKHP
ncbi:MAG: DUF3795 domain-containing protein [archaeon GB-1845-036]|nr:DUF3795 domain-containing protein [Candidatus Culexmicrobium thermophilum]HDO20832.1 DUF3795 domain-containing protein [Candidatus Bathyarchaeota archaeon]